MTARPKALEPTRLDPLAPAHWLPLVRASALAVSAIALLAILGWFTGLRGLASIHPSYIPMAPNTALALLLLAFSLGTKTLPYPSPARLLGRLLTLPVLVITAATLVQAATGADLGVDDLVLRASGSYRDEVRIGAMAPPTAAALLAVAASLLTSRISIKRLIDVAAIVGLVPLLIGFAVLLGYLYGTPLFDHATRIPVALNTGVALLLLSAGTFIALGPRSRPMAPFIGDSVRARLLRAFIPLVVGTVLLQAIFTNVALTWLPENFAIFGTLTALVVIAVFGIVATSVARHIARAIEAAEAANLRTRARFGALLDQLPDFVVVLREGRVAFANPALLRALGHDEDSAIVGRRPEEIVHVDDRDPLAEWLATIARGELGPVRELRWLRPTGEPLTVEVSARLTTFDDGDAVLLVARDVSERRRLEEQLRQSVKMEAVGQLAGGVAHDFNNMLTAILSFSRFVQEDLGPDHKSQPDIAEVLDSAERAASLTRQLLTFSRKQVFDPRPLSVNEVLGRMEKMLQRVIGEDLDLVTVKGRDVGLVRSDPSHIEQILLNLAVNARDAMPEGGKLTIETSAVELDDNYVRGHLGAKPGRYVLIAVTDTGLGMDPETQARIFEPFFTTKSPGSGTGLGLSTVYGIVRQAAGDILVYSSKGRGTTIKIFLPQVVDAPATAPVTQTKRALQPGSETILLVEDDPAVRAVALRTLRGAGYRVLEASTPAEALEQAQHSELPLHLLLTDVVMPGMSGKELATRLTGLRPGVRVLYMSGYTGGALVHQGIVAAGATYLQKPFTPDVLAQTVRDTLDGRSSASERAES